MGYTTRFELEISDNSRKEEVVSSLKELDIIEYALDENLETYDEVKWYSHRDDMKKVSSLFPDVIFTLKGEGEENRDLWVDYYKNGKCQSVKAEIIFQPYDESKLK